MNNRSFHKGEDRAVKRQNAHDVEMREAGDETERFAIEGRNAVIEAFRSGRTIDKLYVQDGCKDGPVLTIKREAAKHGTLIKYVARERLDQLSEGSIRV